MPSKRIGFVVLSLLVGFGFSACSDDEGGGTGTPTGDEGLALAMINDVVVPVIQTLSINNYVNLIGTPAPAVPDQCEPLDVCTTGSAQYCPNQSGFTVEFTTCQTVGDILDGTVNISGTPQGGSGTLAISIGDTDISGDITYSDSEGCFNQSFDEVTVDLDGLILNIVGFMQYCDPPVVINDVIAPSYLDFFITIPARSKNVNVSVFSEPAGTMQVSVYDFGGQAPIVVCDGTIFGQINCYSDLYD